MSAVLSQKVKELGFVDVHELIQLNQRVLQLPQFFSNGSMLMAATYSFALRVDVWIELRQTLAASRSAMPCKGSRS
jgi:hypothetical protein